MPNNLIAAVRLLTFAFFTFFVFFIFSIHARAQNFQPFSPVPTTKTSFANPVLRTTGAGCAADNLRAERYASDVSADERVKLCRAIEEITNKLNRTAWSPALAAELESVWQVFSNESVTLHSMPPGTPAQRLAMAQPFPPGSSGNRFAAAVYVRPEKSADAAFFQILFHELRHALDFYETWRDKTALDSIEIERRAYLLMGKLTQETPEKEKFSGVPKFWKESWRKRSETEISVKRLQAVEKYLRGKKHYRDLAHDPNRRTLDYSYLKTASRPGDRQIAGVYDKKAGERLPSHQTLPQTAALLPQNIPFG